MIEMKLSIIIVSYNTRDVTHQCLESLRQVTDLTWGTDFEVIVVDNGSSDDSVGMITQSFPMVELIEAGENLGFSKGNNRGLPSLNPSSEYVLFLNSDTTVPSSTLSTMIKHMDENPAIGISTCKVVLQSGLIDWDCHRGFPTPWAAVTRLTGLSKVFPGSKLFNQYNQGWKNLNLSHEIDSVVGAFEFVRREVGEKIEWWDEDYFLNGEDIDLCFKTKQAGFTVMYFPDCLITHFRGASKGTRREGQKLSTASKEGKILVARSSVDSMEIFYNKHLRKRYNLLVNWYVDLGLWILRQKRVVLRKLKN